MKKSMGMKLAAVLLLAAVCFGGVKAKAAETVTVPELDVTLTLPEEMVGFTRELDEDDENLAALGLTADALLSEFETKHIYFNGISYEPLHEIVVTMTEDEGLNQIFDFNQYSDKEMNEMAEMLVDSDETKQSGINYSFVEVYQQNQAKFVVFDINQLMSGMTVYGRQYYTVINGQAINVTVQSYEGEVTEEMKTELKGIVDSLAFGEVKENPNKKVSLTGKSPLNTIITGVFLVIGAAVVIGIVAAVIKKGKKGSKKTCAVCGAKLSSESGFCPNCGSRTGEQTGGQGGIL